MPKSRPQSLTQDRLQALLEDKKRKLMATSRTPGLITNTPRLITTRWDQELIHEAQRAKKAHYNRTYRRRHPEREGTMEPIYKARWLARQRGLEPTPLPNWDNAPEIFEVHFHPGIHPGQPVNPASQPYISSTSSSTFSSSTEQISYNGPDANLLPNAHNNIALGRAQQALNKGSGRLNKRSGRGRKTGGYRNGEGHVFPRCRLCGRSFRRFKSQIVQPGDGSFCSILCRDAAWHLFSEALALEQLEPILRELVAAVKKRDQQKAAGTPQGTKQYEYYRQPV
jgi:hypothetical protein